MVTGAVPLGVVTVRLVEPVPRPARDAEAIGDVVGGVGVAGHRDGRPGEVVVQHLPQPRVIGEAGIGQGLVEAGDRAAVHLLVHAVAAVHAHDRRLVAVGVRVGRRTTQRLSPVRGEPLGVVRMEAVAERVAHHLVGHHPGVPRGRQPAHAVHPTRSLEDSSIHRSSIARAAEQRLGKRGDPRVAWERDSRRGSTMADTDSRSDQVKQVLVEAARTELAAITAVTKFWAGWVEAADKFAQALSDELARVDDEKQPDGDTVGRMTDLTREYLRDLTALPDVAVKHFNGELQKIGAPKRRKSRAVRVKD